MSLYPPAPTPASHPSPPPHSPPPFSPYGTMVSPDGAMHTIDNPGYPIYGHRIFIVPRCDEQCYTFRVTLHSSWPLLHFLFLFEDLLASVAFFYSFFVFLFFLPLGLCCICEMNFCPFARSAKARARFHSR